MAATYSFDQLRARLSPESHARAAFLTDEMDRERTLVELGLARTLTHDLVAAELRMNPALIAKIKRRNDM